MASPQETIPGMRGRLSGPRVLLQRNTTLPKYPSSEAGVRFGTSSTPKIPIGSMNDQEILLSSTSSTALSIESQWELPSRGHVGMLSLIAAEFAIFTIFVVAYLFRSEERRVGKECR